MEVGIIGAPQSGKTTLFTAITGINPGHEVGKKAVVKIPDDRLEHLTKIFKPKKQVNATINFIDAPPPQSMESKRGGAASGFLNFIKQVDAITMLCACYKEGGFKELQDMIEILILTDLEVVEGIMNKEKKLAIDPKYVGPSAETLKKLADSLGNMQMVKNIDLTEKEKESLRGVQLFTKIPIFVVLNTTEKGGTDEEKKAAAYLDGLGIPHLSICATVEADIATLPPEERATFLDEYGIKEPALNRVIREVFDLLGYQTFFTAGEDETRAWTIKKGDNAVTAAGKIHTDIAKGFIRAECCTWEDFLHCDSSLKVAKEHGKLRLEGKEYIIHDGEITYFRHSG
jgi:GTP-binding protein YchF